VGRLERGRLCGRLRDDHAELGRLAAASHPGDPRLADAHDRIRDAERRVTEIDDELATLAGDLVDEAEVAAALADFDAVWDCLAPHEQARVIELLVERIAYDGDGGNISITFLPSGIKSLAADRRRRQLAKAKRHVCEISPQVRRPGIRARAITGQRDPRSG
jgi:hypothetical protein